MRRRAGRGRARRAPAAAARAAPGAGARAGARRARRGAPVPGRARRRRRAARRRRRRRAPAARGRVQRLPVLGADADERRRGGDRARRARRRADRGRGRRRRPPDCCRSRSHARCRKRADAPRAALDGRARGGARALRAVRDADRSRAPARARAGHARRQVRVPAVRAAVRARGPDEADPDRRPPRRRADVGGAAAAGRDRVLRPHRRATEGVLPEPDRADGVAAGGRRPGVELADDVEALLVNRVRGARAVDRGDRRVLRARRADPHALARVHRRRRRLARAGHVLRRARPAQPRWR